MGLIMSDKNNSLNEKSPSVQTHLSILQSIIQRMAVNSTSCKTWCITIVSAMLVVVSSKEKADYAWLTLIPTILFLALDAYYLALEKGFRQAYNSFIVKLHNNQIFPNDLYLVIPEGSQSKHQVAALKSFSVWGFYVSLVIMIVLARLYVIT